MAVAKKGAAPAAPKEPKFFRVTLGKSVRFREVVLNPRDDLIVADDALAELGDAVIDKVEVTADGTEV